MQRVQTCRLQAGPPCCSLPGPAAIYQGAARPYAPPAAYCCWQQGLQVCCLMQVLHAAASSPCGPGLQPLL
jgi:hypothetical protein